MYNRSRGVPNIPGIFRPLHCSRQGCPQHSHAGCARVRVRVQTNSCCVCGARAYRPIYVSINCSVKKHQRAITVNTAIAIGAVGILHFYCTCFCLPASCSWCFRPSFGCVFAPALPCPSYRRRSPPPPRHALGPKPLTRVQATHRALAEHAKLDPFGAFHIPPHCPHFGTAATAAAASGGGGCSSTAFRAGASFGSNETQMLSGIPRRCT